MFCVDLKWKQQGKDKCAPFPIIEEGSRTINFGNRELDFSDILLGGEYRSWVGSVK